VTDNCLTDPTCLTDPVCLTDPDPECETSSTICLDSRGECEIKARVRIKPVGDSTNCLTRFPSVVTFEAECPADVTMIEWIQIKPAGLPLPIQTSGNRMSVVINQPHSQGYEWAAICSRPA
jgi:hypothetical protein